MGNFQKKINVEIELINDYINIIVEDNGTGFTNNNLKTLSKPYFTTKKEGSGLGLSIVEKILNDHNGFIEFISQKEQCDAYSRSDRKLGQWANNANNLLEGLAAFPICPQRHGVRSHNPESLSEIWTKPLMSCHPL